MVSGFVWVTMIALACLIVMQTGHAAGPPIAAPSGAQSAADRAFLAAQRANQRDDLIALATASAQLPPDYALTDYVTYWSLRLQLRATDQPDATLSKAVRHFITQHSDKVSGDLMRRQWMLNLARRGQWREMLDLLPNWRRRNDTRVFCRAGQARMALGRAPGQDALRRLAT